MRDEVNGPAPFYVQCECGWRGPATINRLGAVEAWNRRTPPLTVEGVQGEDPSLLAAEQRGERRGLERAALEAETFVSVNGVDVGAVVAAAIRALTK